MIISVCANWPTMALYTYIIIHIYLYFLIFLLCWHGIKYITMGVHIYKDEWVIYIHSQSGNFQRFSFTFLLLGFVPKVLHKQGKLLSYIPSYKVILIPLLLSVNLCLFLCVCVTSCTHSWIWERERERGGYTCHDLIHPWCCTSLSTLSEMDVCCYIRRG